MGILVFSYRVIIYLWFIEHGLCDKKCVRPYRRRMSRLTWLRASRFHRDMSRLGPKAPSHHAPFSVHPSFLVFGVTNDLSLQNAIQNVFFFKSFTQLLKEAFCKIGFAQPEEKLTGFYQELILFCQSWLPRLYYDNHTNIQILI